MVMVVLTRPLRLLQKTAGILQAQGYAVLPLSVMTIVPTGLMPVRGDEDAVIATSANAFLTKQYADFLSLPCFVIGSQTAKAAEGAGFTYIITAPARTVEALIFAIEDALPQAKQFAYFTGDVRKPNLEQNLVQKGLRVHVHEVYRSQAVTHWPDDAFTKFVVALDACQNGMQRLACLHYSRRSATLFLALCREHGLSAQLLETVRRHMVHICLSPDVAAPLQDWQAKFILVAKTAREEEMVDLLQENVPLAF